MTAMCVLDLGVFLVKPLTTRPDNLPALKKKSTISTFEHYLVLYLVLNKNRTFSSTNKENQHYFETLLALTLKIRTALSLSVENGYLINWYLLSKYHVKFEVSTDHDCESR